MSPDDSRQRTVDLATRLASELAEYAAPRQPPSARIGDADRVPLDPEAGLLAAYDSRILDPDLRDATRSRFVSTHYADAVEAGVKVLNEVVRARTKLTDDGDALMTTAFSPKGPMLRISKGRSKNDESAQRGHMQLCQGVIAAWRNPRAHSLVDDAPERALMMLETINDLIQTTKNATRTRRRGSS